MTVEKLIDSYKLKVNAIDTELQTILEAIRTKRRNNEDYSYLLQERVNKEDVRQAYFQIVKDLEDISL